MRNHITNSNFRIPNSAFNLEVIRLDEGPVLKTGGCRNVACEFESHDFRSEQILRSLLFYFFQKQGCSPGSGLGFQPRWTVFESLRPCSCHIPFKVFHP